LKFTFLFSGGFKNQWEIPKINGTSQNSMGNSQKSTEYQQNISKNQWTLPKINRNLEHPKKKRRPKNPQEFPWEIPKDRLPSSSGLRGRGKSENSDALDPSAASAALSVASARRVDMGHGEIHGKIHGKSLVVGYFPIMNLY
jgi:hypothetical protein